ncbi:hypothetical protein B0G77_7215 [Paraburkholderia sp. BL10I2N1]|nr:hypothetical protein [Paraburkholderia sp. BL10I2N1]TDN63544.1 hypothetical protein B0G77_7215 [Paraburkholderia sp. BL10I2N1]
MVPYLSERENAVEHINTMCSRLFDLWCERRSIMPLTFLLRGWPLVSSDPEPLRRLGNAIRDLRRQHLHELSADAFQQLCELSDCVEDLLALWSVTNRATATG